MLFTNIARLTDGLLLVASVDSATGQGSSISRYQSDAKLLIGQLNSQSPIQCTIESGEYSFHYLIEGILVFLTLTQRDFPKRNVFAYLSELSDTFKRYLQLKSTSGDWETAVATIDRPYAFIQFDKEIQRVRKKYSDLGNTKNMSKINEELLEVQGIMKKNIQDVLGRGDRLEKAAEASSNLVFESKRFSSKAKKLNWLHLYKTYGPLAAVVLVVIFLLYLRFFW